MTRAPASWPVHARTCDGIGYLVRPITPADLEKERDFIRRMSPESRYYRFQHSMVEPSPRALRDLVCVDGRRSMALVATIDQAGERIIGVARYAADASGKACEFAVAVADDWQCRGIGTTLMPLLFEYAKQQGFEVIYGIILADNQRMIELAEWQGLTVDPPAPGSDTVRAWRRLT